MAANFLLTDSGDIAVGADGSTRWTTTLAVETAQRLRAKFGLFLGEWFLDLREGVPYYRDILVRNPNMSVVRATLRKVVVTDPGVDDVPVFDVELGADRTLSVGFTCVLTSGEIMTLEPFTI